MNTPLLSSWAAAALILALAGCGGELETQYGKRSGVEGDKSVNGTAVLADMFADSGHRVVSRRSLSPSLDTADVIVWAPDHFQPPTEEVTQWLEDWLAAESGRTVVYIGRDFDAAPGYWRQVRPNTAGEQQQEIGRRIRDADSDFKEQRKSLPQTADCPWFTLDTTNTPAKVSTLSGPWSRGVDAKKARIELNSVLVAKDSWPYEVLLASGNDLLVGEQQIAADYGGSSRLIVVANGSFLLNVPLVNHEHRKLAGRLIDHVGAPPQRVVFLESGPGEVPIRSAEPVSGPPSVLSMISVWPLAPIVAHLSVLGLIFVYARWPIFGVARRLPAAALSDFGRHVVALGRLLRLTRDEAFASEQISGYRQAGESDGAPQQQA